MVRFIESINIQNKWFISTLFAFFILYLVLRAIFVEPLLDELGTLYFYIQTGDIVNESTVLNANNHLLNSYVSHYLHRIFGDHLIVSRLFAICCFPVFYFSAKKLVDENIKQFRLIIFLALVSIPWVFDYFSLSRGYGPAIAFFTLGLSFINGWNAKGKPKDITIILISFTFCLLSNLTMIVPILLIFGYLHLSLLIQWKQRDLTSKVYTYILSSGFLVIVYILYLYIDQLKTAGALWWGSKDGLWEVTGKSVSQTVFFTDSDYIKYALVIVLSILAVVFTVFLFKKAWKEFLLSISFWAFTLFILSLISFALLVRLVDINYPQDRAGMYLILLLILSFGSLLSEQGVLKWTIPLLLWFPVSFLTNVNLNTTIFSPEDRMHRSFYLNSQKMIGRNDILTADYVAHLCYSYASRESLVGKMAVLNHSDSLIGEEYHLSSAYGNITDWTDYTCVLSDPVTEMKLYKRNQVYVKNSIKDSIYNAIESNEMYIPLIEYKLDEITYKEVQVSIEGSVHLDKGMLTLDIIEELVDKKNVSTGYTSTCFHWYFGKKQNYSFNFSRKITEQEFQNNTLKIYMYNHEMEQVKLYNLRIKVFGLSER